MSRTLSAPSRMAFSVLVGWRLALMIRTAPPGLAGARLVQLADQVGPIGLGEAEV